MALRHDHCLCMLVTLLLFGLCVDLSPVGLACHFVVGDLDDRIVILSLDSLFHIEIIQQHRNKDIQYNSMQGSRRKGQIHLVQHRQSLGFRGKQSKSSLQQIQLSKLVVSTSKITFSYRGGHNQYAFNKQLKLTNNTGTKIGFKIKSNNPQNYEVTPSQQKIQKGQVCQIRMRLYIQNSSIQKYLADRFMIEWGSSNACGQVEYSHNVILNVDVVTVSNVKTKPVIKNFNELKSQLSTYKEMKYKNETKMKKLQKELSELESVSKPWVISMPIGVILGFLSFGIGYLIF